MIETINNLIATTIYFIVESLFFGFIVWVTWMGVGKIFFPSIDLTYWNMVMMLLSFKVIRYDFFKIFSSQSNKVQYVERIEKREEDRA